LWTRFTSHSSWVTDETTIDVFSSLLSCFYRKLQLEKPRYVIPCELDLSQALREFQKFSHHHPRANHQPVVSANNNLVDETLSASQRLTFSTDRVPASDVS
jgi:hypothetical protein